MQKTVEVLAITIFCQWRRQFLQLIGIDPFLPEGNLFRTSDFEALATLERGNELAGIEQ
ncbi:hypothetical protein D3C76_1670120 [compost metagenome]